MTFDPATVHATLDTPLLGRLHTLATTTFRAREPALHEAAALPLENLAALFELGLLTATVSRAHGGLGSNLGTDDPATYLQAIRTVARGSPGTAHCLQVQNHVAWALDELGTNAQRARFLAPMCARPSVSSFVGSEANRRHMYVLNTTAARVAGGYRVNGAKNYATNGYEHGIAIVFASLAGEPEYLKNHLMLIVEAGMDGLSTDHDWYRPTGMRVAPSPVIHLENVFIPDENVLGAPGAYPRGRWQGRFHLGFAANYLGTIEGAYDWVLDYLRERGRAQDPLAQLRIGEIQTQIFTAQTVFEHAIAAWRTHPVVEAELISMRAKSICAQTALQAARALARLAGSTALFDAYPLGRLMRDLDTHTLHVGHDRTHQIIGAAQFGETFDSTLQR